MLDIITRDGKYCSKGDSCYKNSDYCGGVYCIIEAFNVEFVDFFGDSLDSFSSLTRVLELGMDLVFYVADCLL